MHTICSFGLLTTVHSVVHVPTFLQKLLQQVPVKRRYHRHNHKTEISQVTALTISRSPPCSALCHWFPVACLVGRMKYIHTRGLILDHSDICFTLRIVLNLSHKREQCLLNAKPNFAAHSRHVIALVWFACCDSHLVSSFGERWASLLMLLTMCNRTILH